jgi:MFS family permease
VTIPTLPAPDRAARRAVTAVFLINGLTVSAFVARIPDVQRQLDIGEGALGTVLAALSVGVILGIVLSGRWVGRLGSQRLGFAGGMVSVIALPLVGATSDAVLAAVALAAVGFGTAILDIGMNAQGIGVERTYGRSIMVGFHGAWSVGALLGAVTGSWATAQRVPVDLHLSVVAVCIALVLLVAIRWLRMADRATLGTAPTFALPRGALFPLALVAMAATLGESTAGDWSGIHLRDEVGVVTARIGWGYVAYTSGMVLIRVVGDAVVRRLGAQRVVTGGGWAAAAGFLLLATVPTLPAALLGLAIAGIGVGSTVPLAFAEAGKVADAPGQGVAAVATVAYLVFAVAPPLVGAITEAANLRVAFALIAVLVAVLSTRRITTG